MPSNFGPYQPYTGFNTQDPNTGNAQDLGQRYTTKSYLIDAYPNISSVLGARTTPGLWVLGGLNTYGNLGTNDPTGPGTGRSSPIQIGSLTNWKQVSAGYYGAAAIKTDGTLWTWGGNNYTQLGIGTTGAHRSSPVQVGSLTNWKQVMAGNYFDVAIQTDGTLWSWGDNRFTGQLGLGDLAQRSSPVQVGLLTNWKQIGVIGAGATVFAIKTDGTLWAWGDNYDGALGLGDTAHRSSPVQVGSLTTWKQVNGSMAIKTDGTLWTWGYNTYGQLGLGDTVSRSSPVQVGSLTNWKQCCGSGTSAVAIKTDGTLWTWGYNLYGQLGLGDVVHRSSPVQVGSLTNWKQAFTTGQNILAIKTDGTIWAWGLYTALGLGDSISRSSPVQVGSSTNWKQISNNNTESFAIQDGSF